MAFGQGEWTCTIADFTGTMKDPMKGADGKMIPATNKKFKGPAPDHYLPLLYIIALEREGEPVSFPVEEIADTKGRAGG